MPIEQIEQAIREVAQADVPLPGVSNVGKWFHDQNNMPEGIRAPHALAAVPTADRVDCYHIDAEGEVRLWLCLADVRVAGYTMLTQVMRIGTTNPATLTAAWRLYGWARSEGPTTAFATVIDRYGIMLTAIPGNIEAKFIGHFVVPPGESGGVSMSGFEREGLLNVFVRRTLDGTDWAWCFGFDPLAYAADVKRLRG